MKKLISIGGIGIVALLVACGGDDNPCPELVVTIDSSETTIEVGADITFQDNSLGDPTSWLWTFEGGAPSTSTEQNPRVTYDETGNFDVQLVTQGCSTADTLSLEDYVRVVEELYEVSAPMRVVYGIDAEQHILDLYTPREASEQTPLIIMMGGGGFFQGSGLQLLRPFSETFAQEGIAVASARYRQVTGPATSDRYNEGINKCAQDTKAAVRYFRANAAQYNINPKLIFIGGNSSGAIGSLVAGYYDEEDFQANENEIAAIYGGFEGAQGNMLQSSQVAGVISLGGEMYGSVAPIDAQDPPFFGACAFDDQEIACDTRTNAGGFIAYGAIPVHAKALEVGLRSTHYIFDFGDHDTPRERPQDYRNEFMTWIEPILDNPPTIQNPEPFLYYQSFNEGCSSSDCLPESWTSFSISNEYDWEWTEVEGGSLHINSFSEVNDDPTENWLITEAIDLTGSPSPLLLLDYTLRFADTDGYGLQVFASTTYDGDFDQGEWEAISDLFNTPTLERNQGPEYFQNVRISLESYQNQTVHFAIRYTSSGALKGADKSLEARIDNLRVQK